MRKARRVGIYFEIFCTAELAPRKSIVTKAIKDTGLVERLCAEQQRICGLLERRRAVACRDRSAALLTVAHDVLTRYQNEKERRGLVDYDDLIDKALALLREVDAAWVHYKLDLGIDHLLIDEAQDTSKKQWEIVCRLAAEFTAGAGARSVKRTIFAVGDEKQSIYSFQNAAPREFADMRRRSGARATRTAGSNSSSASSSTRFGPARACSARWTKCSRQSTSPLASARTPTVFRRTLRCRTRRPACSRSGNRKNRTNGARSGRMGCAVRSGVNETSPRVKLARRIAHTVRGLVDGPHPNPPPHAGEGWEGERRAARYGDILVLVRQRGELFEAIIRALKNENVEVAGADRLVLTEHIAVMDLIALADALLLREDDLALATVLRSPLFGFEDEDLFAIAWDRGRCSLRAALARKAGEKFAKTAARLDQLALAARRQTPFAFFAEILGAGGARRRFLARLGAEANDALDEFLNLALDYERRQTPSLQGFVAWLREARAEVKRDMEIARDEVRVMTVHGAKGLEAPIVILADTMTPPPVRGRRGS